MKGADNTEYKLYQFKWIEHQLQTRTDRTFVTYKTSQHIGKYKQTDGHKILDPEMVAYIKIIYFYRGMTSLA
jgi:hypothetical protein